MDHRRLAAGSVPAPSRLQGAARGSAHVARGEAAPPSPTAGHRTGHRRLQGALRLQRSASLPLQEEQPREGPAAGAPRPRRTRTATSSSRRGQNRDQLRGRGGPTKITLWVGTDSVVKVATVYLLAKNIYFLVQFGSHVCTFLLYVQKQTTTTKKKKKSKHLILTGLPKNLTNSANPGGSTEAGIFFFFFPFSFNIRTCLQVVTIQRLFFLFCFVFTIITTTITKN